MFDNFITKLITAYNLILQSSDIIYKKKQIKIIKTELGMDETQDFGSVFYDYIRSEKRHGVIYTPMEIANYIIEGTLSEEQIIKNPFIKIIDPACGVGNLIIPCFRYLKKIFMKNLEVINKEHKLDLREEDINSHIVYNNLYASDIDISSIMALSIDLFCEAECFCSDNIILCDFLIENKFMRKFDIFIGNPPYVGHKSVDRSYSQILKEKYNGIYKDKGDISYCFLKRAFELAKEGGKISYITSRYFMEAPSGIELRKLIKEKTSLIKVFDFYGIRPFREAGIDPVILFMEYDKSGKQIEIIRPEKQCKSSFNPIVKDIFTGKVCGFETFKIEIDDLNDCGWRLLNGFEKRISEKIESKCINRLEDICTSNQGIITGCDAAFIVTSEVLAEEKLEKGIIKPWIKGKNINKYFVAYPTKYVIYSNLIEKEENYPNIIKHISKYKEKLLTRRECRNGLRKWYELQWGRKKELFEGTKIIFPYKSDSNKFALDQGSFFSADIYSMSITKSENIDYSVLLKLLNSSIYEFYFKTFGKKLGNNMYEYYPNTVMRLRIPDMGALKNIDEDGLFDYFELNDEEKYYIQNLYG